MDLPHVVAILGLPAPDDQLYAEMAPHGYRLLHRLPQLAPVLIERLVERFATLPEIMSATAAELESVEGIGAATARHHPRRVGPHGRGEHLRAVRIAGESGKIGSCRSAD